MVDESVVILILLAKKVEDEKTRYMLYSEKRKKDRPLNM